MKQKCKVINKNRLKIMQYFINFKTIFYHLFFHQAHLNIYEIKVKYIILLLLFSSSPIFSTNTILNNMLEKFIIVHKLLSIILIISISYLFLSIFNWPLKCQHQYLISYWIFYFIYHLDCHNFVYLYYIWIISHQFHQRHDHK